MAYWQWVVFILIAVVMYTIGGGLLYRQVLQENENVLVWWKITLFTIICGPGAWVLWLGAYIMMIRARPHTPYPYTVRLKILNWLTTK